MSALPSPNLQSFVCEDFFSPSRIETMCKDSLPKAKFLSHLKLESLEDNLLELVSSSLRQCPSLTSLLLDVRNCGNLIPFLRGLSSLHLRQLALTESRNLADEEIDAVFGLSTLRSLSFSIAMSQFSVVANALLTVSPQLTRLVIDSVPEPNHNESLLALFKALSSTSIRSLSIIECGFALDNLDDCLNLLPNTRLSFLSFRNCYLFNELENGRDFLKYSRDQMDWTRRFPNIKDRFCLIQVKNDRIRQIRHAVSGCAYLAAFLLALRVFMAVVNRSRYRYRRTQNRPPLKCEVGQGRQKR
jgi:hypothetical protein